MFSIGDLSMRTGVKIPTIRYYEQMGLISADGRTDGNQRRYGADGLERLSFIKHSRDLGLSISAIRDMIRLSEHPRRPCGDADRIVGEHLAAVRAKIARLKRLERELARIASACDGGEIGNCDVIRALADHSLCESRH
ncbi:MAG: helix-turn-helix domain-containing protein [Rhizobiaceae bacterium]